MTRLRRALGPLAAIWLCCQVGLVVCTAAVLATGAVEDVLVCDCVHGDNVMCPMHHRSGAGARICLIGSADAGQSAVLSSMFAFVGVLASPTSAAIGTPTSMAFRQLDETTTSRRPIPPEPPPPRA